MKRLRMPCVVLMLGMSVCAGAQDAPESCAPKEAAKTIPRVWMDDAVNSRTLKARLGTRINIALGEADYKAILSADRSPVLYLAHMPLAGLVPIASSAVTCSVTFLLDRTKEAAANWKALDQAALNKGTSELDVMVGLGPDDKGETMVLKDKTLALEVRAPHAMQWFWGGVVILLVLTWKLRGKQWALIRDRGSFAEGVSGTPSFSLARTQLFLWLLFMLVATLYLWSVTSALPELSGTVLLILLVSGGTTVSAKLVEQANQSKLHPSKGFFRDVTNEDLDAAADTPSLHRLQQLVVTLLLLAAGAVTVYRDLSFPVFDDNWLLLMGLSAGTYLLGKKSEKA